MAEQQLSILKMILREEEIPFFSDEQLAFYLGQNNEDVTATAYQCLLIKAENSTFQVSGLNLPDMSGYFRRLAAQYRPSNSGTLRG